MNGLDADATRRAAAQSRPVGTERRKKEPFINCSLVQALKRSCAHDPCATCSPKPGLSLIFRAKSQNILQLEEEIKVKQTQPKH